ncbi:MAG: pantetheine-phosphate adenylyltransferase [Actinobacteria bacterium]|nr:pantetheine-phosphate adenylyltransferase [Actinomycetota bacterium]
MKRVVCPGSFDPITFGHLDIIKRASSIFDEIVIAVLVNQTKQTLFTVDERIEMIGEVTAQYKNVKVASWSGLLVDYCKANDISMIVKGLRAVTDFDYELQMSQINLQLQGVETLFMSTAPAHSFLSSSLVKEIASYGGDVSSYIPEPILKRLKARLAANSAGNNLN